MGAEGFTAAATQSEPLTGRGTILGTLQYMAPEQLEGKDADHRTDIFAFGAVVYEMATGQRAFSGESQASLIAAILDREPVAMSTLQPVTPPALDYVVKTCLAKSPDDRWQSVGDVGRNVKGIVESRSQADIAALVAPEPQRPSWPRAWPWVAAVVLAVVTGVAVWSVVRPATGDPARLIITSGLPYVSNPRTVAISPDGQQVAYLVSTAQLASQLHLRPLEQLVPTRLPPGGGLPFNPFFSPDGEWLGFYDNLDSKLKKVSVGGGPALEICGLPVGSRLRGATWGLDNTIIFATEATDSGLWSVSADGGTPQQLTTPDQQGDHLWPEMLPGGDAVLLTVMQQSAPATAQLAVHSLGGDDVDLLGLGGSQPRYIPTGHVVYAVDGALRAVGFDAGRLEATTDSITVMDGIVTQNTGAANFDVALNGSLMYLEAAGEDREAAGRILMSVDRQGGATPLTSRRAAYQYPRFAPGDEQRVAVVIRRDISVLEVPSQRLTQITFDGRNTFYPVWTPDAARLTVANGTNASPPPYRVRWMPAASGSSMETLLQSSNMPVYPTTWGPNGRTLGYYGTDPASPVTRRDLYTLSVKEDGTPGTPVPLLKTPANERGPFFSSDGRWFTYISDKTDQNEVYVRPYPPDGDTEFQVSFGGGQEPVWAPDGSEIFYRNGEQMWVVPVEYEPTFAPGQPSLLFDRPYDFDRSSVRGVPYYDVSPDGQRFVMVQTEQRAESGRLILVQNWFDELQRLVPSP